MLAITALKAFYKEYEIQAPGFPLLYCDEEGRIVQGKSSPTDCACRNQQPHRRLQAAQQTRYWGETVINLCCDTGYAMWAVPILQNNILVGSLLVQGVDLECAVPGFQEKVQRAATLLLELALKHNLLSQAEIELARQRAQTESQRFLALESSKEALLADDLRNIYLLEEPELLSAIKAGQVIQARSILNRILTVIYGISGDRLEFLKSCVLELVVMMHRAAVEAGAQPSTVLGQHYRSLVELAAIDDEEDLAFWIRRMLDHLIERIQLASESPHSLLLLKATRHMRSHLHGHLSREEVARAAGVSPSHFSKLMKERIGMTFSQLLSQMRVSRAKQLLIGTENTLSEIALECGFCDQSHMNKVFRAATSLSPAHFRKGQENAGKEAD
jgi:AraC-like DNA-binding protein